MESPVRIKSGAAVLLAVCVFLEICNGYPNNQKSNELINSNEPSDSETSTLFVQPQNRPVFSTPRYGPRNATWKFTRKDAVTPIQYITPTPTQGQINITTTLRNEAPTYKTDLPDSVAATVTTINNKIRSRGSIKFGTTRQPFKPKVPHRTMTTLKPEPIETTRPSFIPTNPVSYKDKLNTTNKSIIETKKEKLNNIDSTPRYTRRNSTRLRGEASNKSSVSVTTTLPTVQKIKERYTTTTRRPIEVKKEIISNTILQPRFTRRNTTRLRVEAPEKSSAESFKPKSTTTRVPEVLIASTNYTTTTNKPSEKASESLNSIEVAFDNKSVHEKSVNRSDNIKSIDIGSFEIDKYTSDEFHDVNNVYSQSISPEIEHYIIPENVSDYYVSVGSGSYPQHADNYIHTKSPTSSITGPHLDFFDQQFKEVSESIKQTLDQADYENEQLSTENTEVDPVNFDDLLAEAPNNNTVVSYKNTKEIILNDSKDPLHRSSLHANGKNIYYEKSILSTESYNLTPSTEGPTAADVPKVKEEISSPPTTPSGSNRVEQYAQPDNSNRVQKSEPTSTRRIDFFKNNGTRREFLTTIRMRAHTTPKPRIRISLKTNKNLQNTTAPADRAEDASTVKSPEIVKMFPFSRRRTTLTTVSSNLDPIQQELSSPSRVVDPTKSDQDNSIPTLRKRGSVDSSKNVSIKDNDISSQYTIPPTAWALITLRDAPGSKKTNGPNTSEPLLPLQADNAIKTEDELQKLEKHSDSSVQSNNPAISITYKSNNETPPKSIETNKLNSIPITGPSNSITGPNDGFNKSEDSFKTDTKKNLIPDNDQGYSSYESITKLPSDVTTPVYDKIPESVTSVNFMSTDYFGTGSTDGSTPDDDDEEDAETVSYEMNTEANEETNDYNSGSISNSNLEMTTMNHIPLVELFTFPTENADAETTTQYLTTTETVTTTKDKATTTGDVQETSSVQFTDEHPITSTIETPVSSDETNTIISKKYVTLASTDKTTKTYFEDTSVDLPQSTTNPTTVKTFESTTIPYRFRVTTATTTPDDDLDDFSFTTMYSSTPESEITTTVLPKIPTEHSNAADVTTSEIKSSSEDIEAASTMYYGTTRANNGDLSTTTFSLTTNGYVTGRPTTYRIPDTESSTLFVTQKSPDSREGKHKIIIDDEDKTANTVNSSDQNNADDWSDTNVDVKSIDPYEINRNNNKTVSENDSSENDTDFNGSEIDTPTIIVRNETQPEGAVTEKTNIEVIKPNLSDGMSNDPEDERETTPGYGQDMKFDTEDGTGAVAAITISVIGVVALLLLIILLMVARGRRTGGGYGQRCTPVSLDSYSLDNVSVNGSTRRKARRPSKRSYGNPAYDESGATSHPMQFAALTNFSLDQESIVSEFNEIPVITVRADEIPPGCESKNRFSNVIPLPETRVSLKPIAGDETSDYINANYVRGPKNLKNYYIACQAPMASTVTDFWRMIWEQNSRVILMLTEFMENGVEKCFEYIPPSEVSDNKRLFGDYKILVKKREIRDKYIISQLQLKNLNTRTWREVTHIWYFWPAKGVPEECHSIIAFLIEARSYLKASQNAKEFDEDGHDSMLTYNGSSLATNQTQISIDPDESNNSNEDGEVNIYNVQRGEKSKNGAVKNGTLTLGDGSRGGPLVVHCSPGTGRTGAVIACDIGIRDFEMVRTVDVPKTVYKIRRDRANSVQTKDQYIFIYKVLSEYATKLTGGVLDSI